MANISTLVNDFASALAPTFTGSATVAGGVVDCSGNSAILSTDVFTFTGSTLILKVSTGTDSYADHAVVCCEGITAGKRGLGRHWGTDKWRLIQINADYTFQSNVGAFGGSNPWAKIEYDVAETRYYYSADGAAWTLAVTDTNTLGTEYDGKKLRLNYEVFAQVGVAAAGASAGAIQWYRKVCNLIP